MYSECAEIYGNNHFITLSLTFSAQENAQIDDTPISVMDRMNFTYTDCIMYWMDIIIPYLVIIKGLSWDFNNPVDCRISPKTTTVRLGRILLGSFWM